MPRKNRVSKVDKTTGEILDEDNSILPPPSKLDKTRPLSDEQYALIAKLPDSEKGHYMHGFNSQGWKQEDIERHYLAAHFPEIRYYSSGGGGKGSASPPRKRI